MNFESSVINIAIEDIIPNHFKPRLVFDDASLNDLSASIKEHGIIQPLVVRRLGDKYEIVAGERRYRAAKMAGLTSVPAVLSKIDDKTSAEVAISENVQRKELNPIEEAKSYQALLSQGFMSKQDLAQKIGVPQNVLENKLKLLTLAKEVQDALLNNKISERHARSLLRVTDPTLQVLMLGQIIKGRYTVRKTDEEIEKLLKGELNMSDNNEMKTIIPTSKIYEEEPQQVVIPKIEEVTPVVAPEIKQVVEVAPVPVEIEEKVEVPKIEQKIFRKRNFCKYAYA